MEAIQQCELSPISNPNELELLLNIVKKSFVSEWSDAQKLALTSCIREKNGHRPPDGEFKKVWKLILDTIQNSEIKVLFENDIIFPTWVGLHREYKELKFDVLRKYDVNFSNVSDILIMFFLTCR